MKDFLGKELAIGDKIVGAVSHGRNAGASLSKGKIIRFTPKMVICELHDYTGAYESERKITPDKIIKMS